MQVSPFKDKKTQRRLNLELLDLAARTSISKSKRITIYIYTNCVCHFYMKTNWQNEAWVCFPLIHKEHEERPFVVHGFPHLRVRTVSVDVKQR